MGNAVENDIVDRHIDVGRKDSDEQGHHAPGSGLTDGRNEQTDTAEDLEEAADVDQRPVGRQIIWHDPHERLGGNEVERARRYQEQAQQ